MVLSDAQLEVPKIFLFTSDELQNGHAYIRQVPTHLKQIICTDNQLQPIHI